MNWEQKQANVGHKQTKKSWNKKQASVEHKTS